MLEGELTARRHLLFALDTALWLHTDAWNYGGHLDDDDTVPGLVAAAALQTLCPRLALSLHLPRGIRSGDRLLPVRAAPSAAPRAPPAPAAAAHVPASRAQDAHRVPNAGSDAALARGRHGAAAHAQPVLKNIDSLQQRLDVGCLRLPSFTINHRWQHSRPEQS